MKVAVIFGLAALAVSTVNAVNLSELIEEEWGLFKVYIKKYIYIVKLIKF